MIQDFYTQDFSVKVRTETKVSGKLNRTYSDPVSYKGALFEVSTDRVVRFDKQDFVISVNLYCDVSTIIKRGDIVVWEGEEYDVVSVVDSNKEGHHYFIGLTRR